MNKKTARLLIRLVTAVTFAGMVAVNALANILPINGVNTGQVSDSYANLFAPAGLTFAIWGVIYLLLAAFVLYQFGLFQPKSSPADEILLTKVSLAFSLSSIANTAWIFCWHYRLIPLTMVLMLVILACLAYISLQIRSRSSGKRDLIFVKIPFGVYFGWITVATIANATTLLVDLGWNRFGMPEQIWMILMVIIGMLVGSATTVRNRDAAYNLVLIWAYAGILIKHLTASGFAGKYPEIIGVVIACIVLLLIALAATLARAVTRRGQPARSDQ
jgi:hypothetical protein